MPGRGGFRSVESFPDRGSTESDDEPPAAGVQNLIDRIRDEGVEAGQLEADKILQKARAEAAHIVAEAFRRDGVTVLLVPFVLKGSMTRVEGGFMAGGYVAYLFAGYYFGA